MLSLQGIQLDTVSKIHVLFHRLLADEAVRTCQDGAEQEQQDEDEGDGYGLIHSIGNSAVR